MVSSDYDICCVNKNVKTKDIFIARNEPGIIARVFRSLNELKPSITWVQAERHILLGSIIGFTLNELEPRATCKLVFKYVWP